MMTKLRRAVMLATALLTVAAILDQMRRPGEQRTWYGTVLGVPYDFRPPTLARLKAAWWNENEPRMFLPRDFGVGWSVNLHHLKLILLGPGRRDGDE